MRYSLKIKFLKDFDDSYDKYKEESIASDHIPKIGECVYIESFYHRVVDVVYELSCGEVTLHLGKSAQST